MNNDPRPLADFMKLLDLDYETDNSFDTATDEDIREFSIHSLAATAALSTIRNFLDNFSPSDHSLQNCALHSYLNQYDFDQDSSSIVKLLFEIRENLLINLSATHELDQLKCFLRLMSCSGVPVSVTETSSHIPDFSETKILFKHFEIVKTVYDDFDETVYSINTTYHKLRLILSGDIEENPGPQTHCTVCLDEKKRLKEMQREIAKLKKAQVKQNHCLQRQLELEKRDRKKKREACSDRKRHAQSLISDTAGKLVSDAMTACSNPSTLAETAKAGAYVAANAVFPGVGTAAAAVVNGSKLSAAVNKLNPTMDMIQGVLKTLTEASDELKSLFKIPSDYDLLGILISFASIAQCLKQKQVFLLTLHCTNLARQLRITLDSLMSLIPSFSDMSISFNSPSSSARVGQSLVTDMFTTAAAAPELLPFTGFLSFFCGAFSLLCSGTIPTPSDMTKHFSNVGRAAQGFRALKEMFAWIQEYLSKIYYTTVYGLSPEEYAFMQDFPRLENLYAAVKFIEKMDKTLLDSSAPISDQVLLVNHELNDYHYKATRMNSRSSSHLINSLQKRIKSQVDWATSSPARCHTIRNCPIGLYLFGQPGVGKSVATEVLKARIFKKYLKSKGIKFEASAFPRRAKNEYWEGYTGQPIVILDDFGNVVDSVNKPVDEYDELQRMINTAQFPLKMAVLEAKGCTNFTSEYIIASSNLRYPDIKSLQDPGAVFRRFHVWADVTIDPAYGKPIGNDEKGNSYHTYDRETVAQRKGVDIKDVPPLSVEHYRFTCYTVSHNKQKGVAEVKYIPGKSGLSFDQFWDYFCSENERRKVDSNALANAIREEAGIEAPETPATEQEVLDKFDEIFNPEKFIDVLAADDKFNDDDTYVDAEADPTFGSIAHIFIARKRCDDIRKLFTEYRDSCKAQFTSLWSKIKMCAKAAANTLISVAQFVLSLFSSLTQTCINYLPSVPTSKLLTGLCSTALALFGVWYTGLFCSKSPTDLNPFCQFNHSPSNATAPCGKCKACAILEYPDTGNMLDHFLDRTGIKSVRDDLLTTGIDRDQLEMSRERVRREIPQTRARSQCQILLFTNSPHPQQTYEEAVKMFTSTCLAGCSHCDSLALDNINLDDTDAVLHASWNLWTSYNSPQAATAQRVYDTQPHVPRTQSYAQRAYDNQPYAPHQRPYAQRMYDSAPRMPRSRPLAQGFVECKTEMHIGARKYAQRDRVQIEQTTQVLLNNSVWVQVVDTNGLCSRSNGVFLVGRTMITTAHTMLNPPAAAPIEYVIIRNPYSVEAAIKIPINQCQISQAFQLDNSPVDLALVSFPAVVPNRPRILSKFLNADDIDLLKEGDLTFSGFYQVGQKTIVQEKYPSSFHVSTKATEYHLHPRGSCPKSSDDCICPVSIGNHVEYDLETMNGMCGALLSISNRLIHTKLIGFHVAGGVGSLALGALTTRQFLEKALADHVAKFGIPPSYLIDGRLPYSQSWVDTTRKVSLLDLGDCLNVGTAPAPPAPSTTQLAPSLIFDKVQPHIMKPANLKPVHVQGEGLVDPMIKGIKKVMGSQTFLDPDLLNAAANDVFQGLGKPPTGLGTVHSYEEAIVGVEGDPYKRPINRTTSPGYPFNMNNKTKGKTAWLGAGEDYIVDNPELKKEVTDLINDSRNGIRGNAISLATLKDEKRPNEKVDAGKTRVFEACPQHLVIAIRQYFLDFAAHVMRNRINNGIAVGINPYSLEWTKLAHHLLSKGNNMIAGDFSNFDGSLLMQVLVKILEKINEWYGDCPENQLIRAALWEHICNADILVRGEVIRKTHSQPSGNPLTVIINSLFNGIVMRIAYMLIKKEQGLPAVCDYRKHVAEIIYGDDDVKSVSTEIIGWFNQTTLTTALASFGLTYTDETKSGATLPYKRLEDTAFLKRKFAIQSDGTYLAPMDLENLLEITNWIRGKAHKSATIENCEQTIMELSLHPQAVYEFWSTRIQEELGKVGLSMIIPTYYEQMETYRYNRDMYARTEYVPLW